MTKLNVMGMSCSHCKKSVEDALSEFISVSSIQVNLEEKSVAFQLENESDLIKIVKVIEELGFDVVE